MAQARARAAARFEARAAAADAAAEQAVAALAQTERSAAGLYDEWRLRYVASVSKSSET